MNPACLKAALVYVTVGLGKNDCYTEGTVARKTKTNKKQDFFIFRCDLHLHIYNVTVMETHRKEKKDDCWVQRAWSISNHWGMGAQICSDN